MSRPKKERIVHEPPIYTRFKPVGIRSYAVEQIPFTIDEYEAIRLADYLGMEHSEAAEEMEISRSTFTRLIEIARKKMADFLVEGKELFIEGGNIHFRENLIRCLDCGHMFKTNFEKKVIKCPVCDSNNLLDLAGGFGHGRCCRRGNKGRR